jgi:hypothetical protein
MKRYGYILTLIFTLTCGSVYAHQDFWMTEDFGNVKVRIKTGYKYEEIQKVFLFGQLAKQLAEQLNYSEQIFLDFNHYYVGNCEPDYFISFDKGKIQYTWHGADKEKDFLKKKSIVVRQVARQFDTQTTLKLLEYAILNIRDIKSSQKEMEYHKNYCQWRINSIDTNLIKKILNEPNSNQIVKALDLKIERKGINSILYYLQNNKYSVVLRDNRKGDTVLVTLDNIYQIYDNLHVVIFDTDSSFYYVDDFRKKLSERHVIQNMYGFYEPYFINPIGGNKLSIFYRFDTKPEFDARFNDIVSRNVRRTSIYFVDKDILIQDLDEIINEKINLQNE